MGKFTNKLQKDFTALEKEYEPAKYEKFKPGESEETIRKINEDQVFSQDDDV